MYHGCARCCQTVAIVFGLLVCACSDRGSGPVSLSPLIETVYVNECGALSAYEYPSLVQTPITVAPDGWSIESFAFGEAGQPEYFVLISPNEELRVLGTSLRRRTDDGDLVELYGYSSCTGCEGYSAFDEVYLSPDGRYLAVNVNGWEWGGIRVYDLIGEHFVDFEYSHHAEYQWFLVWHPTRSGFFATSWYGLYEFDIADGTTRQLPSPNLRDYVTEAELLNQGYVGRRVDFERLVGDEYPTLVGWHPNGWHFAFERDDDLYVFHMADSTEELIYRGEYD